jgi:hypothetical protein
MAEKKINKKPSGTAAAKPALRRPIEAIPQTTTALADLPLRLGVPPLGVHVFHLAWDTSRVPDQRHRSHQKQHATGVKFDESGIIALSNGRTFESVDEMEEVLRTAGSYAIEWL